VDLKEEEILGDRVGDHWYYRSKALALQRLLEPFLPCGKVLDVGAGSGFFARELIVARASQEVTCVDPGYAEDRDEHVTGGVIRFRRTVDSSDAQLALFMDVLEHVDDDRQMLDDYRRILGPGKLVAVTVPAFQFLWSGHDVFLEHRRRYTLSSLEDVMHASGLAVVRGHYFFGAVFPVAAGVRLVGRSRGTPKVASSLKEYGPTANRVLTRICTGETRIQKYNRLAGLSVFALGVTRPGPEG
jgi:2-polyprenyl-3-methyl-5-hydroxy-6-metoxy-1,4-benzoquinol methylase